LMTAAPVWIAWAAMPTRARPLATAPHPGAGVPQRRRNPERPKHDRPEGLKKAADGLFSALSQVRRQDIDPLTSYMA